MKILVKKPSFLTLFWMDAFFLFLAHLVQNNLFVYITAPLLNLFLLLHYRSTCGRNKAFSLALFFCFLGDCMLLVDHFNYFISGITAYWGASIMFYISFLKKLEGNLMAQLKKKKAMLPFGLYTIYFAGLMFFIHSFMNDLFYPTFLYSITLSLTCALSGLLWLENKNIASRNVFYGCLLVSVSATAIGLNKFVITNQSFRFLEVLFYSPCLYYLYLGFKDPFFDENL